MGWHKIVFEKPMAGAGNADSASLSDDGGNAGNAGNADLAAIALAKGGSIAEFRTTGEVG
jgi:hypothetical protein